MPTLEQLSGTSHPEPAKDATSLVRRCSTFARIELAELSDEGVRTLVGQQMYLEWLLPVALERLGRNLWIEGDFYPGALLAAVVRSADHPQAANWLTEIKHFARHAVDSSEFGELPAEVKVRLSSLAEPLTKP